MRETHDYKSLPLMVRPNSALAVGGYEDHPDYDYGEGVTLQVYELADGKSATAVIPSVAGDVDVRFEVKREGRMITVERRGASKRWQLLLVGIEAVASAEGGVIESNKNGVLVRSMYGADCLKISLDVTT